MTARLTRWISARRLATETTLLIDLSCTGDIGPSLETVRERQTSRVRTDRTYLRDDFGRYLMIHGINVSGSNKTPFTGEGDDWPPELVDYSDLPFTYCRIPEVRPGLRRFSHAAGVVAIPQRYTGIACGIAPRHRRKIPRRNPRRTCGLRHYVGRNMALEDADRWFGLLRDLGFNAVRLLIVWEGIEPEQRGIYDQDSIDYLGELDPPRGPVAEDDAIAGFFGALVPPDTNTLRGDGAPRWAVQACLPHKDMDSPHWGDPYIIEPALVVGAATVLEPDNALGGMLVGVETSLDLRLYWNNIFEGHIIGTLLIPGKAGGALINELDRDATDLIYGPLVTVEARY